MIKKVLLLALVIFSVSTLLGAPNVQAVDVLPQEICDKAPDNAACADKQAGGGEDPISGSSGFLARMTNLISVLVGIAAVVGIVLGGLKMITSGNNPQEVTKGREMVLYSMVAIFIVVLAQAMVRFFLDRVFQ